MEKKTKWLLVKILLFVNIWIGALWLKANVGGLSIGGIIIVSVIVGYFMNKEIKSYREQTKKEVVSHNT